MSGYVFILYNLMPVQTIRQKNNPLVSVIIPSLDGYRGGNVPKLIQALNNQTFQDFEVLVVVKEKPCARAHNVGVQSAQGEIVVFFDDDVTLGGDKVIENLITPLRSAVHITPNAQRQTQNPRPIGITGASTLLPPDANRFQRHCAKELPRFEFPIVREITESDMVTHAAMAVKKPTFTEVGGENENLIFGDDPELRARVRKAGYKIVITPNTWIFHPPPSNLPNYLRMSFRRGIGAAHDFWRYPHLIYETPPASSRTFVPHRPFQYRAIRFIIQNIEAIVNLKLVFFPVRLAYGAGYLIGLAKQFISPRACANKQDNL